MLKTLEEKQYTCLIEFKNIFLFLEIPKSFRIVKFHSDFSKKNFLTFFPFYHSNKFDLGQIL